MAIGVVCFLLLLLLLVVPSFKVLREGGRMFLQPSLTRVDDNTLACEDEVAVLSAQLVALGFTPEGTYAQVTEDPDPAIVQQGLFVGFLAPDARTEAQILLSRVLSRHPDEHTAVTVCKLVLRSFLVDGTTLFTTSSRTGGPLPKSPCHRAQYVSGPPAVAFASHQRRLVRDAIEARALRPDDLLDRERALYEEAVSFWLARGLIRREADRYVRTTRLCVRSYLRFVVLPFGEHAVGPSTLRFAVLLAAGAAGAWWIAGLAPTVVPWAASAEFALLTILVPILGFSQLGVGHACCVLALVYLALGVTTGVPWVIALVSTVLVLPQLQASRARRQQALFHAAGGSRVTPDTNLS